MNNPYLQAAIESLESKKDFASQLALMSIRALINEDDDNGEKTE